MNSIKNTSVEEDRIIEKVWQLSQIIAVTKKIHSSLNMEEVLSSFINISVSELGAEGGVFYSSEKSGENFKLDKKDENSLIKKFHSIGLKIAEIVSMEGNPLILNGSDVLEFITEKKITISEIPDNLISLPLRSDDGLIFGNIVLYNKNGNSF